MRATGRPPFYSMGSPTGRAGKGLGISSASLGASPWGWPIPKGTALCASQTSMGASGVRKGVEGAEEEGRGHG